MKIFAISFIVIFFKTTHAFAGFWQSRWEELTSPVTTEGKYYLLGGAALTGVLVIDGVEDSLGHDLQNETVEDKPLGGLSKFGDLAGQMIPNALYFGTMYGFYLMTDEELYRSKSFHMLKSTLYTALTTTIIKKIVREPRPNPTSTGRDSFPSGHTATAFAFAAVVGTEHELPWAIAAYGLAGLVAYSRINDNMHRLHDVVGGAVIGLTYGLSLHYLYQPKESDQNISLLPYGDGLSFQYNLEF